MNNLLPALIIALILTIFIEYLILIIMTRNDWGHLLIYSILINCLTNPLLNYFYLFVFPQLFILETSVVLIEAVLIHFLMGIRIRYAFVCSVCANGSSIIIGYFLGQVSLT